MKKPLTLKRRVELAQKLSKVELPYEVWTIFCENSLVSVHGDQVSFGNGDFATIGEVQNALTYLVNQFGGKVKWE